MDANKFAFVYIFLAALAFGIFGNHKTGEYAPGKFLAWLLVPVLLILYLIFGFVARKRMRWLRKYWVLISFNQLWKFLTTNKNRTL